MTDKITLYTNPRSRGRIARRMLEELGVDYEAKVLKYGENKTPEFLKLNSMGKFPTLVHGDLVVTEGAAIITYLADAFPDKGFAPPLGSKERGTYFRWIFFAAGPLEAALTDKFLGINVDTPELKRTVGYGCVDDVISAFDKHLSENEYILGDKFSAADIYVGSTLGFYMEFKMMPELPSLKRYYDLIHSRPAIIRANEIDNALLAKIG